MRHVYNVMDDPFENQFHMIFNEEGQVLQTVDFAPVFDKHEDWAQHIGVPPERAFYSCLSVMDRARFLSLCQWKPLRRSHVGQKNLAVFCLEGFYGYSFALAEKNLTIVDDRVYVRFFNGYTRFMDSVTMVYREYLDTWGRYRVPPAGLLEAGKSPRERLKPTCPPFVDLLSLTRRIVSRIGSDPGFYGNALRVTGDGARLLQFTDWREDEEFLYYPLYFSAPVLTSAIYAVLTAFANLTASHEMEMSIDREAWDGVYRLKTRIHEPRRVGKRTPEAVSEYDVMLLSFAFQLALRGHIMPSARFSPENRMLTVTLRVVDPFPGEGDFRCNEGDPEEQITCILEEAEDFISLFPRVPGLSKESAGSGR